jgi:hypothetical protein
MGAIESRLKMIVAADEVSRYRQELEILDAQGSCLIRERKRPVGIRPGAFPAGLATVFELVARFTSRSFPSRL